MVPPRIATKFVFKCGSKTFEDTITFARPPVIGCFTLEALPITIVYEPPGSSSSQKYSSSKSIGTTIETFTSKEGSGTTPLDTPFSRVGDAIDAINTIGKAVATVYPQVGKGMQEASKGMRQLWGDSKTDETISNTVTDKHTLAIQMTNNNWQATGTHQGPGKGDAIHFLLKPTFLWLAAQDEKTNSVYITVALIGYEGAGSGSAEDLRQGNLQLPSKEMQKLMLQLDPLTPEYAGGSSKGPPTAAMKLLGARCRERSARRAASADSSPPTPSSTSSPERRAAWVTAARSRSRTFTPKSTATPSPRRKPAGSSAISPRTSHMMGPRASR